MKREVIFVDEETLTPEEIRQLLCGKDGETEVESGEETKE